MSHYFDDYGDLLTEEEARGLVADYDGNNPIPLDWRFIGGVHVAGSYEGSTLQYWEHNGKVYEYDDSHCSCNGFEWAPSEVTLSYLRHVEAHKAAKLQPLLDKFIAALAAKEPSRG